MTLSLCGCHQSSQEEAVYHHLRVFFCHWFDNSLSSGVFRVYPTLKEWYWGMVYTMVYTQFGMVNGVWFFWSPKSGKAKVQGKSTGPSRPSPRGQTMISWNKSLKTIHWNKRLQLDMSWNQFVVGVRLEYGLSMFVITPKWYHQLQNLGVGYRFCPYHIIYIHVNVVNLIIHHPEYRTTHG